MSILLRSSTINILDSLRPGKINNKVLGLKNQAAKILQGTLRYFTIHHVYGGGL